MRGDALAAIAGLGRDRVRMAELSPSAALRTLAWAGASGGAHARRPGAAAGRFAAWWASAALTGLLEHWPVDAGALGDALTRLRWYGWDTGGAATLTVTPNQAPTASITITSGLTNGKFVAGKTITFSGTATDPEDGPLAASAFTWKVEYITSIDSGNLSEIVRTEGWRLGRVARCAFDQSIRLGAG